MYYMHIYISTLTKFINFLAIFAVLNSFSTIFRQFSDILFKETVLDIIEKILEARSSESLKLKVNPVIPVLNAAISGICCKRFE